MHGGSVTVASPGEGLGSTFTVKIPLLGRVEKAEETVARAAAVPTPDFYEDAQPCAPPTPLSGMKVLVVDDEADSRDFVAFVLEEAGASVIAVESACAALAMLASLPDILVSDLGMPDMDGYMLVQKIRALPPEQGGKIPAIALSAYAGEFERQKALVAGFQKHLSKPVEPERLIETVVLAVKVTNSTNKA